LQKAQFLAFDPGFAGGVHVAVGDVNGDGVADIVVAAAAGGGPHVKVVDGTKLHMLQANGEISDSALITQFYAYDGRFPGGVNVAVGDFDLDGDMEVVTAAGAGGGPHVKVWTIDNGVPSLVPGPLGSFYAYDVGFAGGVTVAAASDHGMPELITGAGPGGGPHVKVFDINKSVVAQFYAYDLDFNGGVSVAAADLNGDGRA